MAKKRGKKDSDKIIPFEQEKGKFLNMISDTLKEKKFSTPEEATQMLNEAFVGRTMADSLAEWDTHPLSPLDEARDILFSIPDNTSLQTERRYAKKALAVTKDCMQAWEILAVTYQSPKKIEATLKEGIAHGKELHAHLIAGVSEDVGLWGFHETRPFMELLQSLANFYIQYGTLEDAVAVHEEMLTLNPQDNQGIRGVLLHRQLCLNNLANAEKIVARYPDDLNLGIVYGAVLLELLKALETGVNLEKIAGKTSLIPSDFGASFAVAKAAMRKAFKTNPYFPILLLHPQSIYLEPPSSYQLGSPDEALCALQDFGADWVGSLIGWIFISAFEEEAKSLIKKDSREMREALNEMISQMDQIDEPSWQEVITKEMMPF